MATCSATIASLHAKVLRKVSAEACQHFHGLAHASRSPKLASSSTLGRRLLHLDMAFDVWWWWGHITDVYAEQLCKDIDNVVSALEVWRVLPAPSALMMRGLSVTSL